MGGLVRSRSADTGQSPSLYAQLQGAHKSEEVRAPPFLTCHRWYGSNAIKEVHAGVHQTRISRNFR